MTLFLPFLLLAAAKFTGPTTTSQAERPIDPLYIIPVEAVKLIDTWVRQFRSDGLENGIIENPEETYTANYPHELFDTYGTLQAYGNLLSYSKTTEHDRMEMAKKILRNADHARRMTLYLALTLDAFQVRASDMAADFEKWRSAAANYVETHFGDAKTGELPKGGQTRHHGVPDQPRK